VRADGEHDRGTDERAPGDQLHHVGQLLVKRGRDAAEERERGDEGAGHDGTPTPVPEQQRAHAQCRGRAHERPHQRAGGTTQVDGQHLREVAGVDRQDGECREEQGMQRHAREDRHRRGR